MINGVAGVILWTDNLERLVEFYRDTLDLTPHSIRPNFVAFSFGETRLSIGLHEKVAKMSKDPFRVMVNLTVVDIHHTYGVLKEKQISFMRPPELEHWGGWVATFKDPDGNILQLIQQPR